MQKEEYVRKHFPDIDPGSYPTGNQVMIQLRTAPKKVGNIILANDNRIVSAVPVEEIKESKDPLVKFLNYKMLPYKDDDMFVVSFKPRVTKAGKKMASLVLADTSRELHSVTVFPTSFAKAYMKIDEGGIYKFSLGKTKDGTTTKPFIFLSFINKSYLRSIGLSTNLIKSYIF